EEGTAKHILVCLFRCLFVTNKVHHQRTHHGTSHIGYLPCFRVNIRNKSVTQLKHLTHSLFNLITIFPWFGFAHITMHTEYRTEGTPLIPSYQQFLVVIIGILPRSGSEESSYICSPVW